MATKTITLTEHLASTGLMVIERQPASMVPPAYKNKPKDQQVMTGVRGIEEILLSNGSIVFICSDCEEVYLLAGSASAHRIKHSEKFKATRAAQKANGQVKTKTESVRTPKVIEEKKSDISIAVEKPKKKVEPTLQAQLGAATDQIEDLEKQLKQFTEDLRQSTKTYNELVDRHSSLKDAYQKLLGDHQLVVRACESLNSELATLKSDAGLSDEIKRQFVEAMEDALANFGEKWLKVNEAQQQVAKYAKDIINS